MHSSWHNLLISISQSLQNLLTLNLGNTFLLKKHNLLVESLIIDTIFAVFLAQGRHAIKDVP